MTYKLTQFIETRVFTRLVTHHLTPAEFMGLQCFMAVNPLAGAVISGSGGLRKVRWGVRGRGKSGGIRVIYYFDFGRDTFYLLYLYPKNVVGDLTADQVACLGDLVRKEFK